jgi:ABC-type Fe3+ transport system permease subunit
MAEAIFTLAAAAAGYLGFALLALSQKQHARAAQGSPGTVLPAETVPRRRWAGAAGLATCLTLCLVAGGPSFGALLAALLLTATATAVVFTLTWRPLWLGGLERATNTRQRSGEGSFH